MMGNASERKAAADGFSLRDSAWQRIDDYMALARQSARIRSSIMGDGRAIPLPVGTRVRFFR